jgi:hypothetical protein
MILDSRDDVARRKGGCSVTDRRKQKRRASLRGIFVFLVEPWGIEPQTSKSAMKRAVKNLATWDVRFVPQLGIFVEDYAERLGVNPYQNVASWASRSMSR